MTVAHEIRNIPIIMTKIQANIHNSSFTYIDLAIVYYVIYYTREQNKKIVIVFTFSKLNFWELFQ